MEVGGGLAGMRPGAHLLQQVSTVRCPAHLLLLTMGLAMTWLTADSVNAVKMASPAR